MVLYGTPLTARKVLISEVFFGENANVVVAPNIPKRPIGLMPIVKLPGQLRLVYLSVISEKKNLHLAIKWLGDLGLPVYFDIYGPIKDEGYWQLCKKMINTGLEVYINYKGDVEPPKVQAVLADYHALILPTSGENFGHAIYECLSVGRPAIISDRTPWSDIQIKKAGFVCSLDNEGEFKEVIRELYTLPQGEYDTYCANAISIAENFWDRDVFIDAYSKVF